MSHIVKDLQKIAARTLHNTRGVPRNMNEKLELIELAFGRAEIISDFTAWCAENADRNPPYPVTEYLRGIDARLGGAQRVDPRDERITQLQSLTYELTTVLPHQRAVRDLLAIHSVEDISMALKFYVLNLGEKANMMSAIRAFYDDLGASAVINSMKKKAAAK